MMKQWTAARSPVSWDRNSIVWSTHAWMLVTRRRISNWWEWSKRMHLRVDHGERIVYPVSITFQSWHEKSFYTKLFVFSSSIMASFSLYLSGRIPCTCTLFSEKWLSDTDAGGFRPYSLLLSHTYWIDILIGFYPNTLEFRVYFLLIRILLVVTDLHLPPGIPMVYWWGWHSALNHLNTCKPQASSVPCLCSRSLIRVSSVSLPAWNWTVRIFADFYSGY